MLANAVASEIMTYGLTAAQKASTASETASVALKGSSASEAVSAALKALSASEAAGSSTLKASSAESETASERASKQTTASVPSAAEQKLTALTKVLLDEVFASSRTPTDFANIIKGGEKLSEEITDIAHYVAHSAIHVAALPGDDSMPTNEQFFANLDPMINNLTFRIVTEVSVISDQHSNTVIIFTAGLNKPLND